MSKGIAIIGYGRFGRLIARHLSKRCTVSVFDRRRIKRPGKNVRIVSYHDALQMSVIILAVPISELKILLQRAGRAINRESLVIDICAVKEDPVRWMRSFLPSTVTLLGAHPLFGPSSASKSIQGKTVVLCPIRITSTHYRKLRALFRHAGLSVLEMTPKEHDRWMARTLFITQYIGRGLRTVVSRKELPTESFRLLQRMVAISTGDSPQLVKDIFQYNRYARDVPRLIRGNLSKVLLS